MTDIEKDPQFVTEAEMELAMERKHKHEETGDVDPESGPESGEYLDEIYDIVDAVVSRTDDPTLPVLTFRVMILGGFFCVALCCANTLFTFIGVLLSYPLGKLMEKILPKGILNPGPFNHKEHALIYICCNSGANTLPPSTPRSSDTVSPVSAVVTLSVPLGIAGLCRRYLVRPAAMLWPSNLSEKPNPDDQYTMSRYKFFWLVTLASALWQIFPGYIAPVPFPSSATLLGSANNGYGLLSLSFDWNIISTLGPITTPLWALLNQIAGMWMFVWVLTPIFWLNNAFGNDFNLGIDEGPNATGTFPLGRAINTPALFNLNGTRVPARYFVLKPDLVLDEEFYNENKPIYISTYFAMEYLSSFMVFIAAIVHVGLWYGKDIWTRFRTALKDLDSTDIHAKLMDVYPEVPDWWYIVCLAINVALAIAVCQWGGFDLPWWGVILGLALAVVSILPIGIIQAISGQAIGLNVMSEFMIGLILPGRMAAVMAFKTLSYMSMYQGLLLVADLKLGHYIKIPPRHMFMVQLATSIVSAILNVFVAKGIYESFGKECDPKNKPECLWKLQTKQAPLGWTAVGYNTFLNAGAIWGAIAPARFFGPGSPYQWTLLGFGIGLVLPFFPWIMHKFFPNGYWHLVNIPLIVVFPGLGAGATRSEMITPLVIGIVVNYFVKKHRHAWWKKYAYVMSAALDSGLAITLTLIFIIFQFGIGAHNESEANRPFPYWALNRYDGEGCAEEYFLKCNENANWGAAWGKTGYFQIKEVDPYCTSINFQGGNADAREAAVKAGIIGEDTIDAIY
ncbi:hypothetical protein HDU97_004361 [Phlyctochytrium planicorne]|nr:hypothetical protein HDU97_004361 [Phlyctochytrium planicorne]